MNVRVLLFAALREKVGASELEYQVEAGETIATLAQRVLGTTVAVLYAVNDEFAEATQELRDGDSVAFIPPMAGG